MKKPRSSSGTTTMRKYYQLLLVIVCFLSVVTLLIYRHEYYRLRYVLEVLNFFGKPGLSEIEFCGPGYNATMLSEILRNSSIEVRETPPLFQQIDDNFYSYSSFLRSYQKYEKLTQTQAHIIDTIVIGKAQITPNFRCNIWMEGSNTPKAGRFTYKAIGEPMNDFNLYIFQCSLSKDLGKPKGVSFYANNYNINPIYASIIRVIQVNTKRKSKRNTNIKFVNNLEPALCVIPNQIPVVSRDSFIEFLVFHRMMGIRYFTIYDSMISEDIIRRLNLVPSDITQWNIQFFPLNYPFVFAKSYNIVRNAVELDCLFRHFRLDKEETEKASHAIVMSWDEFLVPRIHNNIKEIFNDFDPTRRIRTLRLKPLLFCLNQVDDDEVEVGYPEIMKKTHYYMLPQTNLTPIYARNLESMVIFEDIFSLTLSTKELPLEVIGAHKYTECRDPKVFNSSGAGYNQTQMKMFQHRFESAMANYGPNIVSNPIYRLYKSGKIWEKTSSESVRDML